MKKLIIVRHGKAQAANIYLPDFDRTLTEKGIADVNHHAAQVAKHFNTVNLIISSSAKRTSQTAQLVAIHLGYPVNDIIYKPELYLANAETIENMVLELPQQIDSVVIVGHNDGLSYFAQYATQNNQIFLATSDMVIVHFSSKQWHTIFNTNKPDYRLISKH